MFQAWRKPYYAGHPQKLLSQSHYYARHIRHNMYIFQLGHQLSSMENFHPLRRTPSHIDAPNSCWCAEPMLMHRCKLASSPNRVFARLCRTLNTITPNLLCLHQKKIFCWPLWQVGKFRWTFLINWEKNAHIFSATWKFCWPFRLVWSFSWCFWDHSSAPPFPCRLKYCSPDAPRSAQAILCQTPPRFSAQSHYSAGHIKHNVSFSPSGQLPALICWDSV